MGVLACNSSDLVNGILAHLDLCETDPDKPMELQILNETQTSTGKKELLTCKHTVGLTVFGGTIKCGPQSSRVFKP